MFFLQKLTLFLIFFFSSFISIHAQVIDFCTSINKEGQCLDHPDKYYITLGGTGEIYAVTRLLEEVGTTKVEYKIYRINSYLDEYYMTSLYQEVDPKAKTFYKRIAFTMELNYKIYIYTDSGKLLTAAPIFVEADYDY